MSQIVVVVIVRTKVSIAVMNQGDIENSVVPALTQRE